MAKPILEKVKNSIGIEENNLGFDSELLMHINSVKSSLVQLGILQFNIDIDEDTVYPDFGNPALNSLVEHYMLLKTKQVFDPTASETISKTIVNFTIELEGRIVHETEFLETFTNLLLNPDFSLWTNNDPDFWNIVGEVGVTAEVTEVGSGEFHLGSGNGSCNLFVLDSVVDTLEISQDVLTVDSYHWGTVDISACFGGIFITENDNVVKHITTSGKHSFSFIATGTKFGILTNRGGTSDDITLDNIVLYK